MAKTESPGTVATQMAAAPIKHNPIPFTILGFRVDPNPSEWTPKNGAYTRKRVGHVLCKIGGLMFPAEVRVIFPKEGKPVIESTTGEIRYAGKLFKPADDLGKTEREAVLNALSAFERDAAKAFAVWYRKQDGLPALTSRVVAGASNAVTLDDDTDTE